MKTTITILTVLTCLNVISQESCPPTFKEIYNYQVGDKFAYDEEFWCLSEEPKLINYQRITFEVIGKSVSTDTTIYIIDGKLPESAVFSCNKRLYETGYRCDTVVLIDSANHFLNLCNTSWFQFSINSTGPFLSRIKTELVNNTIFKSYGGYENIFDIDTTINKNIEIEEKYMEGIGLYSQSFQKGNDKILIQLESYIKSGDTTFITSPGKNTLTKKQINLYPNPASDYLYIETENNRTIRSITAIDILGRKTGLNVTKFSSNALRIDTGNLRKGMHFLVIDMNTHRVTKKFIKK
jgi:hypothetical protein